MFIVIIEWDGKQPPTSYYNNLHRLGLHVRGDKDEEILVRRTRSQDRSVVVQEGAVLVEAQSLARQVAYIASDSGARSVMIGEMDFPEDTRGTSMSQADQEVVNRFNQAFRQRGRPSLSTNQNIQQWIISCPECLTTSVKNSEKVVIQCPHCGGLRVSTRVGNLHVFDHYPVDLVEWKDMYFVEGHWENCRIDISGKFSDYDKVYQVKLTGKDLEVVEAINGSVLMMGDVVPGIQINPRLLSLLNAVFISRRYYSSKDRQRPRVAAVVNLLAWGLDASLVPLIESDVPEVLDACVITSMTPQVVEFYQSLQKASQQKP